MDGWVTPIGDVNSNLNWSRLFSVGLQSTVTSEGRYKPIDPVIRPSDHNILLVGCSNSVAPSSWYLGCWLSVELQVAPGYMSEFEQLGEIQRHVIPLRRYKLIWIPEFASKPYVLRFSIPYWHERIDIEAWWFDDVLTTDVQESLARIETSINALP